MTHPTEAGERESPFQIVKRVVRDEAFRLQRLHAAGDTENARTAIPRIAKKIVEALHAADLLRTEPGREPFVTDPRSAYFNLRTCVCGRDADHHPSTGHVHECDGFDPDWKWWKKWLYELAVSRPTTPVEPEEGQ